MRDPESPSSSSVETVGEDAGDQRQRNRDVTRCLQGEDVASSRPNCDEEAVQNDRHRNTLFQKQEGGGILAAKISSWQAERERQGTKASQGTGANLQVEEAAEETQRETGP